MRTYQGNNPSGEGWEIILDIGDDWTVWAQTGRQSVWVSIKISSKKKRAEKANYWSAVNVRDGRIAMSHDAKLMAKHHPKMLDILKTKVLDEIIERIATSQDSDTTCPTPQGAA